MHSYHLIVDLRFCNIVCNIIPDLFVVPLEVLGVVESLEGVWSR